MATFLFVGDVGMDFPGDGRPSYSVEPGDHVEADVNPDPRFFDAVAATAVPGADQSTSPTVSNESPQE